MISKAVNFTKKMTNPVCTKIIIGFLIETCIDGDVYIIIYALDHHTVRPFTTIQELKTLVS